MSCHRLLFPDLTLVLPATILLAGLSASDACARAAVAPPTLPTNPASSETIRLAKGWVRTRILQLANVGDLAGVRRELDRGISPNARDADGNSALIHAATGGRLSVVKLLLARGAAIDLANNMGLTALQAAILRGHDATPLYLIGKGARLDTGLKGSRPIHSAIVAGKPAILRALLEAGSGTSGSLSNGETVEDLLRSHLLARRHGRARMAELAATLADYKAARERALIEEETMRITLQENGRCEVFRGEKKTESEPCSLEVRANNFEIAIQTYQWPSGAKTVIEVADTFPERINGHPLQTVKVEGRDCYLNSGSGNTFCYIPPPRPVQDHVGEAKATPPVVLSGRCEQWRENDLLSSYRCTGEVASDCGNFGSPCFITYRGEFAAQVTVGWNGPDHPAAMTQPGSDEFDDVEPDRRNGSTCVKNTRSHATFCFIEDTGNGSR